MTAAACLVGDVDAGPTQVRGRGIQAQDAMSMHALIGRTVIARDLVSRGMRPTLVKSLTNVRQREVRQLWFEKHGQHSTPGQTPKNLVHYLKGDRQHCDISYAAVVYLNLSDQSAKYQIDPAVIIDAYDIVQHDVPTFSVEAMYYIARDWKNRQFHYEDCPKCRLPFITHLEDERHAHCPFCATVGKLSLSAINARAQKMATKDAS